MKKTWGLELFFKKPGLFRLFDKQLIIQVRKCFRITFTFLSAWNFIICISSSFLICIVLGLIKIIHNSRSISPPLFWKHLRNIKIYGFGLLFWFIRWKSKENRSCKIFHFFVIKLKVLLETLSYEELRSWHALTFPVE